jgi:DNA repair protein RadC
MTKAIVDIAKPLGIAVHDHIIVGRGGHPLRYDAALPTGIPIYAFGTKPDSAIP